MLRESIKAAQISAMKAADKSRVATLRLILAAIKDRDIALRTADKKPDDDALIIDVLQKMAKQRRESIALYEQGGRTELAEAEGAELTVINEFLPQQMSKDDTIAAIAAIKDRIGAASMKDMGKLMAELKKEHGTVLDMSIASSLVKAALS